MSAGGASALRAGFLAVAALALLGSCAYAPVAIEGVRTAPGAADEDSPWIFVPVGLWLTRDTVVPLAAGMCEVPACPARVAVAVFEAGGAEAQALARSLREPAVLARRVVAGNERRRRLVAEANRAVAPEIAARRMPRRVAASARRLRHGAASGFVLAIGALEGERRRAHAAVLARPAARGRLRAAVVVGEREGQVLDMVKAVADANLAAPR